MTTKVEESIQVDVPVTTAYNQWTQFEDFPHFMGGVKEVRQLDDRRLHWVAEIAGVRREWEASILEQIPDQKIAWAATAGATNAGAVRFEPAGAMSTIVHLTLEYEPEGHVEQVGDKLGIVERQVTGDLERLDRKSTRLNSSHANISYAVFCLKKKQPLYFLIFFFLSFSLPVLRTKHATPPLNIIITIT